MLGALSESMVRDDLESWIRVRSRVPWDLAAPEVAGPMAGHRDGIAAAADAGDSARADRFRAAWRLARADAEASRPLGFCLLEKWQRQVISRDDIAFRTLPAFAKGGRERYGLTASVPEVFDDCLTQATEAGSAVPLPARAARAYLDVCFFHPFDDGNGRAALLALGFVLAREGVVLDEVGPVQVRRYADDPAGAQALARLVHVLATAAANRGSRPVSLPATPIATWR
ncbi:Fic family protein [Streptomyces sp. NPDC102467]|uniref:Fic family protein n=1 Tax=Streptomyces sp. NPDC102467 TaxID=3366179 RepID=UPI0037FAD5F6